MNVIKNIAVSSFEAIVTHFAIPPKMIEDRWNCSLGESWDYFKLFMWTEKGLHEITETMGKTTDQVQYNPNGSNYIWYPRVFDPNKLKPGIYLLLEDYNNGTWEDFNQVENIAYIFEV